MAHKFLTNARTVKNDEFYTQFSDIEKEVATYLEFDSDTFKDKIVYCNCDDPFESNFFRYFVLNFNSLRLKQLITTSYVPSAVAQTQLPLFTHQNPIKSKGRRANETAIKFVINEVGDVDGNGQFNLTDVAKQLRDNKSNEWRALEGNGDFRSDESIELLQAADIVVTNPPFSLFREYINQLVAFKKKFLIIGNLGCVTYVDVFPLLKDTAVWLGNNYRINGGAMFFEIPESIANPDQIREIVTRPDGSRVHITRVPNIRWFTNLDHGRRHQPLALMTEADVIRYSTKKPFVKYDNYNAIEVSEVKNIPSDFAGVMGVPVSFMDSYNPDQFELVGSNRGVDQDTSGIYGRSTYIEGKEIFKRLFIRHRR